MPKNIPLKEAIAFVAAAYIGIWVFSFAYLANMGRKISRLHKEIEALTKAVEKKK